MAISNSFPSKATKQTASDLWDSATSLLARMARKLRPEQHGSKVAPASQTKHLLSAFSKKAPRFGRKKREVRRGRETDDGKESGLWQRSILMGEKCEPLEFPGVIYYDSNGKQLDEIPIRSPRASPLPSYLCDSLVKREMRY